VPRRSGMRVEIEAKFRAAGTGPLRALERIDRLGPATLGALEEVDEIDRYLDTDDERLASARWACRLRERRGTVRLSLKGPPEPTATGVDTTALHRRPEVEGPAGPGLVPGDWPSSAARVLLERLSGGAALSEWVRLVQRRGERPVVLEGVRIGTLSLDDVRVVHGDRERDRLYVVELELADGLTPPVAVLDALAATDGLRGEPLTKLEHARQSLGR
jgi:inorganic triphosphatase YgiF